MASENAAVLVADQNDAPDQKDAYKQDAVAPAPADDLKPVQKEEEIVVYSLQSNDEKMLKISSNAIRHSETLSNLIRDLSIVPGPTESSSMIPIGNVDEETLKNVIRWCEKHRNEEPKRTPDGTVITEVTIPEWDAAFIGGLDNVQLFNIICASNYLDISELLDYLCKSVANMAKGKNPEELRFLFEIPTDAEDEAAAAAARLAHAARSSV